jgi:UvrD-like helicase C-terminal domain
MNGEIAFIVDWDEEEGDARLSIDDGEREIVIPADALETYTLAWALTVHRAQGSQFPAVVAPWSSSYNVMLSRALLYTAVTRAQSSASSSANTGPSPLRSPGQDNDAATRHLPSGSPSHSTRDTHGQNRAPGAAQLEVSAHHVTADLGECWLPGRSVSGRVRLLG